MIGAGPLSFYADPGKTGFEMSAITRIKEIYADHGFRTVSGEGGISVRAGEVRQSVLRRMAISASGRAWRTEGHVEEIGGARRGQHAIRAAYLDA